MCATHIDTTSRSQPPLSTALEDVMWSLSKAHTMYTYIHMIISDDFYFSVSATAIQTMIARRRLLSGSFCAWCREPLASDMMCCSPVAWCPFREWKCSFVVRVPNTRYYISLCHTFGRFRRYVNSGEFVRVLLSTILYSRVSLYFVRLCLYHLLIRGQKVVLVLYHR